MEGALLRRSANGSIVRLSKSVHVKTLTRHFIDEVDRATRKNEILGLSQQVIDNYQSIDQSLNTLQEKVAMLPQQPNLCAKSDGPKGSAGLAASFEDLIQKAQATRDAASRVHSWIVDYQNLIGSTLWNQVNFYERENEILKKEKELLVLENQSFKEFAHSNKDELMFVKLNERLRFFHDVIKHKEAIILKEKKHRIHKTFEMNSRLMGMHKKQSMLLANIAMLQGQLSGKEQTLVPKMNPDERVPGGQPPEQEVNGNSPNLKDVRPKQPFSARSMAKKVFKEAKSNQDQIEDFLSRLKGVEDSVPKNLNPESQTTIDVNKLYQPKDSKAKDPNRALVLSNFKNFIHQRVERLEEFQERKSQISEEKKHLLRNQVVNQLTGAGGNDCAQTGQSNAAKSKSEQPSQQQLESIQTEISRTDNQIKILLAEITAYSKNNLRRFTQVDSSTRKILEAENRISKAKLKEVEQFLREAKIVPSHSASLTSALEFYHQYQAVYFNLNRFIQEQIKRSKCDKKREPIIQKYSTINSYRKSLMPKEDFRKKPEPEQPENDEQLVNAMTQNVEQMRRLNGVLNITIEENVKLYEANKRQQMKIMEVECQLDSERLRSLKLEEELMELMHAKELVQNQIGEVELKLRKQREKIEKLKNSKQKLLQENDELKIKVAQNVEKINSLLEQIAELSKRNFELQSQFYDQTKSHYQLIDEASSAQAKYQDLLQENKIMEKLLSINTEKLLRKQAEISDLQYKLKLLDQAPMERTMKNDGKRKSALSALKEASDNSFVADFKNIVPRNVKKTGVFTKDQEQEEDLVELSVSQQQKTESQKSVQNSQKSVQNSQKSVQNSQKTDSLREVSKKTVNIRAVTETPAKTPLSVIQSTPKDLVKAYENSEQTEDSKKNFGLGSDSPDDRLNIAEFEGLLKLNDDQLKDVVIVNHPALAQNAQSSKKSLAVNKKPEAIVKPVTSVPNKQSSQKQTKPVQLPKGK